ncbi:transcription factor [Fusarium sporotrichioides]|uniref:Transcription factor n=1 Tax=Fusarium sporotrichioides TaxID=5514 RepID=A0A395RPX5_FUSSP|nr:transcription factor [Fusarium sporotrichioides]
MFAPLAEMTGTTGNIYTVHIGKRLRCTCPHHTKGGQQRAREERTSIETILALKLKKDAKLDPKSGLPQDDEADQDDGLGDGAVTDEDDDSNELPDVALAEEYVYMIENEETRATFVKVGHQDLGYKNRQPKKLDPSILS